MAGENFLVKLRPLCDSDAQYMLEWMKNPETEKCFIKDMKSIEMEDAIIFCRKAAKDALVGTENLKNLHLAITDADDEYMGTISLKNIDYAAGNAEYAISIRSKAQGTGMAAEATKQILFKAFSELKLHRVYLSVLSSNKRAIKFYEKMGFACEGVFRDCVIKEGRYLNMRWYSMLENEWGGFS